MKRIINLAVIGIIAVAGNVQAQTIKEDFDNGVSSFGIAYSARYDTKLPEIFPETEYVYGGAASMEMIPTGRCHTIKVLPENILNIRGFTAENTP